MIPKPIIIRYLIPDSHPSMIEAFENTRQQITEKMKLKSGRIDVQAASRSLQRVMEKMKLERITSDKKEKDDKGKR